jgi:hypothetical protein
MLSTRAIRPYDRKLEAFEDMSVTIYEQLQEALEKLNDGSTAKESRIVTERASRRGSYDHYSWLIWSSWRNLHYEANLFQIFQLSSGQSHWSDGCWTRNRQDCDLRFRVEVVNEKSVASASGAATSFTWTLGRTPIQPGSIVAVVSDANAGPKRGFGGTFRKPSGARSSPYIPCAPDSRPPPRSMSVTCKSSSATPAPR